MFSKKTISIRGPKPAGLSITRDDAGVPHIQANNLIDLTWGVGYCQAIDRATQLQLMRVIGQGRLCELLDDTDDNFAIDRFFRQMNWSHNDKKELNKLSSETREWCQALCDGINTGLSAKPISVLKLMGFKPEPWRIEDVFLIIRMTSYLTLAQSQAEVERLFVELAQSEVSDAHLAALFPIESDSFDRTLLRGLTLEERLIPSSALWQSAAPRAMASNNWVISGKRAQSGSPIMANDPHLEVNRLPAVWYEMALSCPEYQALGFGMPGLPGILIGRTPSVSWGATYTFMDTVDSWVEHCKDGKYRRGKTWRKFTERKELIKRKKHGNQTVVFYENAHGVLEGTPDGESYRLSTCWSPATYGAKSLNANFALTRAQTVKEAMASLGEIESAWNWVIADQEGNIGYQMSGLCPKRHPDWNGFTPAPGWDKDYDWRGFEPASSLPSLYNPDCGYVVTANNDLNAFGAIDPINMPMGDYRARRIAQRIDAAEKHSVESLSAIQMDTYSLQAEAFLGKCLALVDDDKKSSAAFRILSDWDLHYTADSQGAALFEDFYAALRREVFGKNAFGDDAIKHLQTSTGLFIDFYHLFDEVLLDDASVWYDHVTQREAVNGALDDVIRSSTLGTWGQRNRFTFTNILFQGKLPAWLGFDSEEQVMIGGRATPHQGQIYTSAGRKTSFAPSVRLIADMSENVLHTRIAGGASDNRLSPWYKSEIQAWLAGSLKVLQP